MQIELRHDGWAQGELNISTTSRSKRREREGRGKGANSRSRKKRKTSERELVRKSRHFLSAKKENEIIRGKRASEEEIRAVQPPKGRRQKAGVCARDEGGRMAKTEYLSVTTSKANPRKAKRGKEAGGVYGLKRGYHARRRSPRINREKKEIEDGEENS